MNGFSGAILALGVAAAGFLYWKSRQDQAAALAAAQSAPGPGLVQKFENSIKVAFGSTGRKAVTMAAGALGGGARSVAGGVGSVVHSIGGLL